MLRFAQHDNSEVFIRIWYQSIHTLRYYEEIGLITPVNRATNGHRAYTADDVYRIIFVTRLRATGMPIAQVQRYAMLAQQGDTTVGERLDLLEEHRGAVAAKIAELQAHLALISDKIAHYQESHHRELAAQLAEA